MADLSNLIEYQRRCYEADNRETGITNIFHEKNRNVRCFDGDEIALSGTVGQIPLPGEWGEEARKDCFKYRRDKTLVYGALMVVGSESKLGQMGKRLCAPLVYCVCDFTEVHNTIFIRPEVTDLRVNFPVLLAIGAACGRDEEETLDFCANLPPGPWPRETIHSLAASLSELLPKVDFMPLSSFPSLTPQRELKAMVDDPTRGLRCFPAAAMALLPNSPDTRGVLYELNEVARASRFSAPLRDLFSDDRKHQHRKARTPALVSPTILSDAQQRVIAACRVNPITLVVGPPGTGKSHTIAALALDQIANNQKVLIASRMDQAVNVVAGQIEDMLGTTHAVVRAGRKEHLRELKRTLENLLQGITIETGHAQQSSRQLNREFRGLSRRIARIEALMMLGHEREVAWGKLEEPEGESRSWQSIRNGLQKLKTWQLSGFNAWERLEQYETLLAQRCDLSRRLLQTMLSERTAKLLKKRRTDLSKFLQAIRARSDGKQQKLFSEVSFSVLLHAFPVWLCKLTDLTNVLPLERELFDVAILDEATQCDIASCVPLLQRARRVVIVGDPKQLRHISFLSESRQSSIADECGLNESQEERYHFRRNSVLDVASDAITSQSQVVFLDEHFRSRPPIIRFSNAEFYDDRLSIMRQRPDADDSLTNRLFKVEGERGKNGRNKIEADTLVDKMLQRIEESTKSPTHQPPSIGVLSPFREQVDYLSQRINKRLDFEQLQRHDILVGTAHSFQGEERDVMFLSLAADENSHSASFRFLDSPNVLNVSVTRARNQQNVFHSFPLTTLKPTSLLRRWLESLTDADDVTAPGPRELDKFRDAVIAKLSDTGDLEFWSDYLVGGLTIDLIVQRGKRMLGLDLIGYPGRLQDAFRLDRYRMLSRCGLSAYPLTYRDWIENPQRCVDRIVAKLKPANQEETTT